MLSYRFISRPKQQVGSCANATSIIRGANSTSYLRRTIDGGRTWEKVEFQDGGRERMTSFSLARTAKVQLLARAACFTRSRTDDVSWKRNQVRRSTIVLLDGAYSSEKVGAIVGAGGTILFTEDAGFTWENATLLGDSGHKI